MLICWIVAVGLVQEARCSEGDANSGTAGESRDQHPLHTYNCETHCCSYVHPIISSPHIIYLFRLHGNSSQRPWRIHINQQNSLMREKIKEWNLSLIDTNIVILGRKNMKLLRYFELSCNACNTHYSLTYIPY